MVRVQKHISLATGDILFLVYQIQTPVMFHTFLPELYKPELTAISFFYC